MKIDNEMKRVTKKYLSKKLIDSALISTHGFAKYTKFGVEKPAGSREKSKNKQLKIADLQKIRIAEDEILVIEYDSYEASGDMNESFRDHLHRFGINRVIFQAFKTRKYIIKKLP